MRGDYCSRLFLLPSVFPPFLPTFLSLGSPVSFAFLENRQHPPRPTKRTRSYRERRVHSRSKPCSSSSPLLSFSTSSLRVRGSRERTERKSPCHEKKKRKEGRKTGRMGETSEEQRRGETTTLSIYTRVYAPRNGLLRQPQACLPIYLHACSTSRL